MRTASPAVAILVQLLVSAPCLAVTNLSALHRDGQTFLTWGTGPGVGYTFRVYASTIPIQDVESLVQASLVATVRDSTWHNRRLSIATGQVHGYAYDPAKPPLGPGDALCVLTSVSGRTTYYAVTAQVGNWPEGRHIIPGANALVTPVVESVGVPEPVFQRSLIAFDVTVDVYTLWTTNVATALYPAMANRPGVAFDCGVVRGSEGGALMIRPHARGSTFLDAVSGSGAPGEWRLALDDPLPNGQNSFWFGYHEDYDVTSDANLPPTSGIVRDYTLKRIVYTLEWALRSFPVDNRRVYAFGYSMGGIGSIMLAIQRPDLVAGAMAFSGKVDFSFLNDPNPASMFNLGGPLRQDVDRMWGEVSTNLPSEGGSPVYMRLNGASEVAMREAAGVAPIIAFSGKSDSVVGWAEKISFFRAMERHHQGGVMFWDMRDHASNFGAAWLPMQDPSYLYRYRTDLSFPAISNCSTDGEPGYGDAASGDSVGMINAFVDWDPAVIDTPDEWTLTLGLRDLRRQDELVPPPPSVTLDVTLRRVQRFPIDRNILYTFTLDRVVDGARVDSGVVEPDSLGVLTVRWLKIHREGSVLRLTRLGFVLDADPDLAAATRPVIAVPRNPVASPIAFTVTWPRRGAAEVELLDVSGRRVASLFHGMPDPGAHRIHLPAAGLANGVYFITAHQGDSAAIQRVIVLH